MKTHQVLDVSFSKELEETVFTGTEDECDQYMQNNNFRGDYLILEPLTKEEITLVN